MITAPLYTQNREEKVRNARECKKAMHTPHTHITFPPPSLSLFPKGTISRTTGMGGRKQVTTNGMGLVQGEFFFEGNGREVGRENRGGLFLFLFLVKEEEGCILYHTNNGLYAPPHLLPSLLRLLVCFFFFFFFFFGKIN